MNLGDLYPWLVFVHVLGAFLFAASHGVSVWLAFQIGEERDVERLRALLTLSGNSLGGVYVGLIVLLIGGVGAGIIGGHFARWWIWLSLGLLIAIAFAMYAIATTYYLKVRAAVGAPTRGAPATEATATAEEIETLLCSNPAVPLTAIGVIGFVVILWLMVLKPF